MFIYQLQKNEQKSFDKPNNYSGTYITRCIPKECSNSIIILPDDLIGISSKTIAWLAYYMKQVQIHLNIYCGDSTLNNYPCRTATVVFYLCWFVNLLCVSIITEKKTMDGFSGYVGEDKRNSL